MRKNDFKNLEFETLSRVFKTQICKTCTIQDSIFKSHKEIDHISELRAVHEDQDGKIAVQKCAKLVDPKILCNISTRYLFATIGLDRAENELAEVS